METYQFCKNRGSYKYRLGWIWKFTVRQSKHFFPFDLFPKNVGFRPKIYPPKFPMTIFSHLLYICNFPPIFAESLKLWNMFWKLIVGTWNRLAFGGRTYAPARYPIFFFSYLPPKPIWFDAANELQFYCFLPSLFFCHSNLLRAVS